MMRKFSWILLVLIILVLVGCGDEVTEEEEKALKDLVKDEVADTGPEKEIIWEKDGKEMVLIPSGSFEMGDHFNEGQVRELPVHTVKLDAFYMDIHGVTVGQFSEFVDQSGYEYGGNWGKVAKYSPGDGYPMVYVNSYDAVAYAKWAGKRLPTEAEWEYAARGGLVGKRYPWGDEITHDDANYSGTGGKDKWKYCSPVGSFAANGYGLYDMAGNVYEWCQDWYDSDQDSRVLRGGNWFSNTYSLRVAYRFSYVPNARTFDFGFRCVVSGSK